MAFADALRTLNTMKAEGVIEEYAIADAMALVFWTEPVPTFDLDVLVLLPEVPGVLVSLSGIYRWAEARGYPAQEEHLRRPSCSSSSGEARPRSTAAMRPCRCRRRCAW